MFRSLFLAAALMAFTPLVANAGEITLLPSIKLQIGDRDHYYHRGWDKRKAYERGYREGWRDRDDHRGKGRGHGHRH